MKYTVILLESFSNSAAYEDKPIITVHKADSPTHALTMALAERMDEWEGAFGHSVTHEAMATICRDPDMFDEDECDVAYTTLQLLAKMADYDPWSIKVVGVFGPNLLPRKFKAVKVPQ
jgi:hypothetical protein